MKYLFTLILCFCYSYSFTQFAPQYPLTGHEAIHRTSTSIISWASEATVIRGYMDIQNPSLGYVSSGSESNATGAADNMVVSLGDGGMITLKFDRPIMNGDGPDIVVFENAFADPLDPSLAFLELAFVEVSTDGERFVRFPAVSNTQTDSQINNDHYYDASTIHNLAGKYISNYGTPFDLEELKDSIGIDINNINYVRIVDVVGILDESLGSKDHLGNLINDPYPTAFPIGGFDVDAVGALHINTSIGIEAPNVASSIEIYPNPVKSSFIININSQVFDPTIIGAIYDTYGRLIQTFQVGTSSLLINTENWASGNYIVKIGELIKIITKQ